MQLEVVRLSALVHLIIGRWKSFALTFIINYPLSAFNDSFVIPCLSHFQFLVIPFLQNIGNFNYSREHGFLRGKITRAKSWMALDSVTSQFFTLLEPITTASFLSSLSIIHGNDKYASKPVPRHFNLANNSSQIVAIYNLSLNQGNTE